MQLINMAYSLPLNTAYRSYDILIRASRMKKVMAEKGKKSSMETFAPNDKADYYFGITSIIVNGKNAYELKGKFLDDLHNNAFSGTNGKDAVEHIEYYLKIIDPIKLPNVDHDKLRIVVFLISLAGGEYENKTHEEGHELCGIKTREVPVYQIKIYKMIKYSFNDEEEYAAVKEDEYDDLTITCKEACRAYQEIFWMMDKGWMVTRTENFDLEDMELESTNIGPTAKLPILKLGEYKMWAIRIKQYFQIQDYALWEVIENGDSMGFPYPDAKSMFAAIETRFGGNAATKKTQKTLLKQHQSPKVGTASVSDNTKYAFIVENPNGSNVLHQDLEQIHEDDLEAMDLKWQLSLLSVRAKKYYQRTGCTAPKGKEGSIRSDMANNKFNKQGLKVIVIPQSPRQVDKSKIIDKIKNGMGYHDVTPPLPLIFNAPPKHEYVQRCQEEFQHPAIEGYRPKILKECK
ncbi:hypothetical protein Tco_0368492 [Tanacetum coccineum]